MQNMGINQLAQMYMGNPQPLAAKVQQAQQQAKPGEIPRDLEEAIALQKIQEMHNAAGNQQAMQAGGPQPTVVDQLRQAVAPQQQVPQGMPGMPLQAAQGMSPPMPQGIAAPQGMPVRAAHGGSIDHLVSNLGHNYQSGGIIAFDDGGDVEKKRQYTLQEQGADWEARLQAARDAEESGRSPESIKDSEGIMKALKFVGGLPIEALKTLVSAPGYGFSKQEPSRAQVAQSAAPQSGTPDLPVTPSAAPVPARDIAQLAAAQRQAARPAPTISRSNAPAGPTAGDSEMASYFTPQAPTSEAEQLRLQRMRQDPEALAAAKQARYESEVGAPSTVAEKALMEELQAKRAKAQAQANPLLEWGRGVAGARPGQKWWQSGLAGSEYADKIAAQRESADTAFLKEILGQQAKIGEIERGYKLGKFNLGDAERKRIYDETLDAAKAQGVSEDAAKKMAQEAVLKREEMASQEKQTAQREAGAAARHGMPTFSDSQKQALVSDYMQRNPKASRLDATSAVNAAMSGVASERQDLAELRALQKTYADQADMTKNSDRNSRAEAATRLAAVNKKLEAMAGMGETGAAALPMPTTKDALVTGNIYQTSKGPAKWNGSGFTSI